jgi:Sortase domain
VRTSRRSLGAIRRRPAASRTAASRATAAVAVGALAALLTLAGCAGGGPEPAGPGVAGPASPAPQAGGTVAADQAGRAGATTHDPAGPRLGADAPATPPTAPGFEVSDLPGQVTPPGPASPPVRLTIPSIGVTTGLLRLGLEADGSMQVPADFDRAGWFAKSPTPGQVGPAVIAGHVDSRTGPAVFYRLRELRAGDTVQVERADGTRLRFEVEDARRYPKTSFPTAAVFGPAPWAALRLVTCGGDFDRSARSYRDNLVVFARLAGVSR